MQRRLAEARPKKRPSKREVKKMKMKQFQQKTANRHPNAVSIFCRPRLLIAGKRHIPTLVNAGGVPFLRIKKPQPSFLGSVIRTKIRRRQKLINIRNELSMSLIFVEDEDTWDRLTEGEEAVSWGDAIRFSQVEVTRRLEAIDHRNAEVARKMWKVVLAERELAAEEERRQALVDKDQAADDYQFLAAGDGG